MTAVTGHPVAPDSAAGGRRARRLLPLVALILLIAGAAAAASFLIGGDEPAATPTLDGPASAPFHVEYPRSWRAVDAAQLAQLPGSPLAVLRRRDGRGTVVLTRRAPVTQSFDRLAPGLKRSLDRRFPDFREIGAKAIALGDSRALVYTFARTRTGTAQSVVIVPGRTQSFTLNAVVPPRSPDAAREVGAIIASFRPGAAR